jgi:hypothetical protein
MTRLGRFLHVVGREALPAVKGIRAVVLLFGGAATVAAAVLANVLLAIVVGLMIVLGLVLVGSYRAWSAADERARAYEGDAPLQRGIAVSLRDGREIRRRLATTTDDRVAHVEDDVFQWAGDVFQFLDGITAWELAEEWGSLEGIQASSSDEFAQALGGVSRELSRERLLDYMDRGVALLVTFQRRVQG